MIYVTGDTHGDISRFDSPDSKKLKKGDSLIICGDFGFIWNGGPSEDRQLQKLAKKQYNILFVDGAHENFDLLEQYPVTEWNGGKARHICGNVYHLLRGQVFLLEGKTIFTFGGGESQEKQFRIDAGKWWSREMPSPEEMIEGVRNLQKHRRQVDYVVTHEPPSRIQRILSGGKESSLGNFLGSIPVQFEKWFFGSLHADRLIPPNSYALFSSIIPACEPQ